MKFEKMLHEEIESEIKCLEDIEMGSDEYKAGVDGVSKLIDRAIEIEKFNADPIRVWPFTEERCLRIFLQVCQAVNGPARPPGGGSPPAPLMHRSPDAHTPGLRLVITLRCEKMCDIGLKKKRQNGRTLILSLTLTR